MPKTKKAVVDGEIVTNKRDEILGVINQLQAEYDDTVVNFYDTSMETMARTENTLMQEAIAQDMLVGEYDADTAVRQAIGLLKEYAERLEPTEAAVSDGS